MKLHKIMLTIYTKDTVQRAIRELGPAWLRQIELTSQKQLHSPRRDHQTGRNLGLPSLMLPQ